MQSMDLKVKLSLKRIGMNDISDILRLIQNDNNKKQELYDLVFDDNEFIGYHAAWVLTHLSPENNKWLYNKYDELVDEVLVCKHGGKRRVILNLIYKQPLSNLSRVDFLDFCLEHMISSKELPGVQSLCMKIAYELCLPFSELKQELKTTLEMMEGNLCPAIRTTRKNILKALQRGKSIQKQVK